MRTLLALAILLAAGAKPAPNASPTPPSHFEKGGRLQNDHASAEALAKARALADELEDVEEIMIVAHGDDVKVEGEVTSEADQARVKKAIDRMNDLTPGSDHEVVIVSGKSAHVTVPFAFTEGLNSNPAVVQTHVDLANREVTFFAKKQGLATWTVIDPKNRKHVLEYDIRVVADH